LHIHDLYNLFLRKDSNQLYEILKKFEVNEFLCVMTFDILWTSSFDIKCVHYIMETPSNVLSFTLHTKLGVPHPLALGLI